MSEGQAAVNGPYESGDQVRRLPQVRAACDAMTASHRPGHRGCEWLITAACEQAGVTLGAFDLRIVSWLGNFEPETCQVVAGLITRAAQPEPGTVTQWAITFGDGRGGRGVQPYPDEETARRAARELSELEPGLCPDVVSRQVGPWTPAVRKDDERLRKPREGNES